MNKFFIASALAVASLAATALPSQAASIILVNDDGGPYYHRHHHHDRGDWNDHRRHCFTKVVKEWHHGRRVITEERICR